MSLSTIWTFFSCLPELINLIRALELAAKEAETKRKVKTDVKTIHEAFSSNDPAKLNALFTSK